MQGNVWEWVLCRTINPGVAKLLALKQNEEPPQQGGIRSRPSAGILLWYVARYDKRRLQCRDVRRRAAASRVPVFYDHPDTGQRRRSDRRAYSNDRVQTSLREMIGSSMLQALTRIERAIAGPLARAVSLRGAARDQGQRRILDPPAPGYLAPERLRCSLRDARTTTRGANVNRRLRREQCRVIYFTRWSGLK
ncbi:TPA: hypothetical protein QDC03_004352 [Burkholderia cepacia]|uniref:hypothetical protein n=1 Tax=Burkholderia cepacia TaxID=292 RepID=UPI0015E28093|nr:hypothetical protein [Burkholderia cepacia]HDR9509225.1 hypothetical protein [Burkholderia cepacia]